MRSSNSHRDALDRTLQPTPGCIPIERFGEAWTVRENEHLTGCARCQTELALWQEFDSSTPSADEGGAVQWVVAELGRRSAQAPPPIPNRRWWWLERPRFAAAAATIGVATLIGYGLWDPEPVVRMRQDAPQVYRSVRVQAVSPMGDVVAAPRSLEWVPLPGAVVYDVQMLEVDRTSLWRGTASSPRIELPSGVITQLVPGKTLLWEVTARNAAGAVVAESGTQRFRVAAGGGTLRKP